MPVSRFAIPLVTLIALFGGGCGWVDATGRQSGDVTPDDASPRGGVPAPRGVSAPLVLTEKSPRDVRLDGPDGTLENWRWRTLDEPGDVAACAGIDGFDAALAEHTLAAACSDPDSCALLVEERRDEERTLFTLELPALRAPLATRVSLTTIDATGQAVERRRTLCGLSINEAPGAGDDRHEVTLGTTLRVDAGAPGNLLANDSDDIDVRNAPLSIDPRPARAPRHAALFELGDDGGFVYRPRDDSLDGPDDVLEDSFAYTLRDGLFEVVAKVVVVITAGEVVANRPPQASAPLPDVEFALDPLLGVVVRIDLSSRFFDPDGDALAFSIRPGSLPPGGTLALGADGVLSGRLGPDDLGQWRVTVIVDDGRDSIERDFTLSVVRAFEANVAPTVTDIANRSFGGRFTYDVAPFFDDPDGDRLDFSARGLPTGISIDADGVISGRSRGGNRGRWFVVVTADDGRGGEITDGFRLTLE